MTHGTGSGVGVGLGGFNAALGAIMGALGIGDPGPATGGYVGGGPTSGPALGSTVGQTSSTNPVGAGGVTGIKGDLGAGFPGPRGDLGIGNPGGLLGGTGSDGLASNSGGDRLGAPDNAGGSSGPSGRGPGGPSGASGGPDTGGGPSGPSGPSGPAGPSNGGSAGGNAGTGGADLNRGWNPGYQPGDVARALFELERGGGEGSRPTRPSSRNAPRHSAPTPAPVRRPPTAPLPRAGTREQQEGPSPDVLAEVFQRLQQAQDYSNRGR